jgi:hypothetical protein
MNSPPHGPKSQNEEKTYLKIHQAPMGGICTIALNKQRQ